MPLSEFPQDRSITHVELGSGSHADRVQAWLKEGIKSVVGVDLKPSRRHDGGTKAKIQDLKRQQRLLPRTFKIPSKHRPLAPRLINKYLVQGEMLEVLGQIPDHSLELITSDLAIDQYYQQPYEEVEKWIGKAMEEVSRVLSPERGQLILTCAKEMAHWMAQNFDSTHLRVERVFTGNEIQPATTDIHLLRGYEHVYGVLFLAQYDIKPVTNSGPALTKKDLRAIEGSLSEHKTGIGLQAALRNRSQR